MLELLNNVYFVSSAMAVIIFLATQVLKLPIKHFTSKIKNERARKLTNATILLIPFALGILFDYLYATYITHTAFSVLAGLGYGTAGISFYSIVERTFKVKVANPYETAEGKVVVELVEAVMNDGKVDEADIDHVKRFLEKVK